MERLKLFTTFTGIGSIEMALRNIGVEYSLVGTSEVDRYAILAYDAIHNYISIPENVPEVSKDDMLLEISDKNICYNFSTGKSEIPRSMQDIKNVYDAHIRNKNYGDIRKIKEDELPDFDMMTYTFPCKNISIAGKQDGFKEGSDTQSSLLWECRRIIDNKRPKYLVMENVKNLVGKDNLPDFKKWINELSTMGYSSTYRVLNGSDYGVAQNRERVIMVSVLGDDIDKSIFNSHCCKYQILDDILESKVDEKYFMNKPFEFTETFYSNDDNTRRERKILTSAMLNRGIRSNKVVVSSNGVSPTLTAMQGGNRQPKILVKTVVDGKFNNNGFSVRKLTPMECWRCMGFSDEDFLRSKYIYSLSDSKLYERSGRGIVVPMLEDIFKNMFKGGNK